MRVISDWARFVLRMSLILCFFFPLSAQNRFLRRDGYKIFLNGAEFKKVGFNKPDLLFQYYKGGADKIAAKQAIYDMSRYSGPGPIPIAIIGSPFYPVDFEVFFNGDPGRQAVERDRFFQAFDELVADSKRSGVLLAVHLMWNIVNFADLGRHSLHEGVTNFESAGYKKCEEYMLYVINRYKDEPVIGLWVLGSSWNLLADLQMPGGVFSGTAAGDVNHPGPVVRDGRNNFNSKELADLYSRLIARVREADRNHLIATGAAEPRRSAVHLFRAALDGRGPDWTLDNLDDWPDYIEMMNADADLLSLHYYGIPADVSLGFYKDLSVKLNKPIFLGEAGLNYEVFDPDYNSKLGLEFLYSLLGEVVFKELPLSCLWAYSERSGRFQLYRGVTDKALKMIESANYKHRGVMPPRSR